MENYKICALVVTYNRKQLLVRNIESLLSQTVQMDIIIYDNASTDGTFELLKSNGYLDNDRIRYVKAEKNLGGAGGFCNGEKAALEGDYDYIWLMDDDGYCINDRTLEEIVLRINPGKKQIINSYVLCDSENMIPTFGLGPYNTNMLVQENAKDGVLHGYGNAYNGTLIPTSCFKEIGFTDERFFIYGDEADYFYRSNNAGYEWITPIHSLYYHPVNRGIKKYSFLGFKYEVKDQPVWKMYLETRNTRYLGIKYYCTKTSLKHYMKAFLISVRSKDKKIKRLYYSIIAIKDANEGYFGRDIMFNA